MADERAPDISAPVKMMFVTADPAEFARRRPCLPATAPDRYEFGGVLGEGGMGEVRLARDPSLRRAVAMKRILPGVGASPGTEARFVREAQITAQPSGSGTPRVGSSRSPPAISRRLEKIRARSPREWLAHVQWILP